MLALTASIALIIINIILVIINMIITDMIIVINSSIGSRCEGSGCYSMRT